MLTVNINCKKHGQRSPSLLCWVLHTDPEHTTTSIPFFCEVYMAHISHDWNFICHSNSNHLSLKTWKNETLLSVRLPRYEQQCPPTSFHSWILKIKMKIHCWQGCISSKSFCPCTNLLKIPPKNEDTFHWTLHKTLWLLGHRCAFYPPLCESHTSRVRNNLSTHQLHCFHHTNGFNGKGWSCANSGMKTPGAQQGNGVLHKNWINYSMCNNSYTLQRDTGHWFQSCTVGGSVGFHKSSTPTIRIYYYWNILANKRNSCSFGYKSHSSELVFYLLLVNYSVVCHAN